LSNKSFYSPEKKREEKNKRRKRKERKKEAEKRKKKGAVLCVSVLILEVCCDFPLCPGSRL
jgi:hypothetical protein